MTSPVDINFLASFYATIVQDVYAFINVRRQRVFWTARIVSKIFDTVDLGINGGLRRRRISFVFFS